MNSVRASRAGRRAVSLLLAVLMVVALVPPLTAGAVETLQPGKVSGKITDSEGAPVAGATVYLESSYNEATSGYETATGEHFASYAITGADGTYTVADLLAGTYDVGVWPQGPDASPDAAALLDKQVRAGASVTGGDTTNLSDIALDPAASISGKLVANGSTPLPDVGVWAEASGTSDYWYWYESTSKADGTYKIGGMLGGFTYRVQSSSNANDTFVGTSAYDFAYVAPGADVTMRDFTYVTGGHITGHLTDAVYGTPVSNVVVECVSANAWLEGWSDGSGAFDVLVAPGEPHSVNANDWNGGYSSKLYRNNETDTDLFVSPASGESVDVGTLALDKAEGNYYITGHVTDQDGAPVPGVSVSGINESSSYTASGYDGWYYSTGPTYTDADGFYAAPVRPFVSWSPWRMEFYKHDYVTTHPTVQVTDSDATADQQMHLGGTISGTVTDTQGSPLAGVSVAGWWDDTSEYDGRGGLTDDAGHYTIGGFADGAKKVEFNTEPYDSPTGVGFNRYYYNQVPALAMHSASGYDFITTVPVTLGENTPGIDCVLGKSGSLMATANTADGAMSGLQVSLLYKYNDAWIEVDSGYATGGAFESGGLPSGDYKFAYADLFGRMAPGEKLVSLTEGENKTIALVDGSFSGSGSISIPGGSGTFSADFDGLVTGGELNISALPTLPDTLPSGVFQLPGGTFEVDYTGEYAGGTWTLTFPYDPSLPVSLIDGIVVQHYTGGVWVEVTPKSIDKVNHTVTVEVTSLSPFSITIPTPTAVATAMQVTQFQGASASSYNTNYGQPVGLMTALRDSGGTGLPGRAVKLQWSTDGVNFSDSPWGVTNAGGGVYTAVVAPGSAAYFRFAYPGQSYGGVPLETGATSSNAVRVVPRVSLSVPYARSTQRAYRTFSVTGNITPSHSGSRALQVRVYKYKSGRYVKYATYWASATSKGAYASYACRLKLARGTYRVYGYAPADAGHAATGTGYRKITVK